MFLIRSIFITLLLFSYTFAQNNQLSEPISQSAPQKKSIALLDFEHNGIDKSQGEIITSVLESEITKSNSFQLLERQQMNAVLSEQGFQASGACSSTDCQVEIGELLGVELICTGSIGKLGNTFILTAKLIDVQTGAIVKSSNSTTKGYIDDLISISIPKVVSELTGKRKQKIKEDGSDNSLTDLGIAIVNTFKVNDEEPAPKRVIKRKGTLGIKFKKSRGAMQIKKVFPGSPADNADIMVKDYIVKVDGKTVRGRSIKNIKRLLAGYVGESIELELVRKRGSNKRRYSVTLVRD